MKVISLQNTNENTNTLTINLNQPTTVAELFKNPSVAKFAAGAAIDSIASVDNADASLLMRNGDARGLENYQLTDDSVIELDSFAEKVEEAPVAPVKGKVTVSLGGLSQQHSVTILDGQTTVAQALTDKLAAAFDRTKEELHNMRIHVNDIEVNTAAVLHDGDAVVLQGRKAGDHGADDEGFIEVFDANGCYRQYKVTDDDMTLEEFLEEYSKEFGEAAGEVIDSISEIDDNDVYCMSGPVLEAILNAPAMNYTTITVELDFTAPEEDFAAEGAEDKEEFAADGVPEEAPQAPACGKVTVTRSNIDSIEMLVQSGVTTLGDVLFSDKVLNKWAMTKAQMEKMNMFVEDVPVYRTDITLKAGERINIVAPKAGDHGLN